MESRILKTLRQRLNLTQNEAARLLGTSRVYLAQVEAGTKSLGIDSELLATLAIVTMAKLEASLPEETGIPEKSHLEKERDAVEKELTLRKKEVVKMNTAIRQARLKQAFAAEMRTQPEIQNRPLEKFFDKLESDATFDLQTQGTNALRSLQLRIDVLEMQKAFWEKELGEG